MHLFRLTPAQQPTQPRARLHTQSYKPLALLLLSLLFSSLLQAEPCPIQQLDREARVANVYDADTLTLASGERLRVLGIDAPELGRDGRPHEPFALEGRDYLRQLLAMSGNRVHLHLGTEAQDRHGRLLAWLFLPDGRNVQRLLLEQGYVMQVTLAPNTAYAECLKPVEREARQARRGIWSQTEYHPGIAATAIPAGTQGAVILHGRVERIGESRDNLWLNLEGRVALQWPKNDLTADEVQQLRQLQGQAVRVRGWLVRDNSRHHDWRIRINSLHHLEIMP
ncbi:thermonuclease family protein [Marinospirillum alkaliphilum]|uniref:Endonuclease YncB, thermonuclease family n=1 Tax=Marinospirillum alkaliphilum DSM 21637 TaxID=1122209 RepID=A0A1K1WKY6_9GAMM|nr:thermonuclease family protein [Marinospirillum alkaliphilum]SFX37990.1 Endonuclease YncB, thermonuclease family [Marinospirillum alkaliphilum DSM 21637]